MPRGLFYWSVLLGRFQLHCCLWSSERSVLICVLRSNRSVWTHRTPWQRWCRALVRCILRPDRSACSPRLCTDAPAEPASHTPSTPFRFTLNTNTHDFKTCFDTLLHHHTNTALVRPLSLCLTSLWLKKVNVNQTRLNKNADENMIRLWRTSVVWTLSCVSADLYLSLP